MRRIFALIRLLRPLNGLMMGVAVVIGALLALAETISKQIGLNLVLGFFTAFTLSGASMIVNDYYDQELDRINELRRPLVTGEIKPMEGLFFASFLTLMGLGMAYLINLYCFIVAVISWIISIGYNTKGKRTGLLGNMLVSLCVAITFIYGSFVMGATLSLKTFLFAALAFLVNTGREITKGIVDINGDKTMGIRTIGVSFGAFKAACLASAFYLSAIFLSLLPIAFNLVSQLFIPFVTVTDLGLVTSSIILIRDPSKVNARRIKNLIMFWMLFGLFSFIAGNF